MADDEIPSMFLEWKNLDKELPKNQDVWVIIFRVTKYSNEPTPRNALFTYPSDNNSLMYLSEIHNQVNENIEWCKVYWAYIPIPKVLI